IPSAALRPKSRPSRPTGRPFASARRKTTSSPRSANVLRTWSAWIACSLSHSRRSRSPSRSVRISIRTERSSCMGSGENRGVFTVEQRDALRERVLRLANEDERVVAGAAVGSLAVDGGDRFSDLDLTFSIADHVPVADVLSDWTRTLIDELDAVHLADLERGPTIYRVFVLPDAPQFDLSMTPAARFRPAGPRFRLLFGETATADAEAPAPPRAGELFIPTPAVASD